MYLESTEELEFFINFEIFNDYLQFAAIELT